MENNESISKINIEKAIHNLLIVIQESNNNRIKRYELKGSYTNIVTAVAQISEVFGGSCWSEDYHSEKDTPYKEIKPVLKTQFARILNPFFENLGLSTALLENYLDNFLNKTKRYDNVGQYTDYEYYGNSTTYGLYGLNLDNLISETCSEEVQRMYHKELNNFKENLPQSPKLKM